MKLSSLVALTISLMISPIIAAGDQSVDLPRLTPRPVNVAGVKSPVMDLNGEWEFSAGEGIAYKPIHVPGEWAMQGFAVAQNAFASYRRTIDFPADWSNQSVKIRFDAVHAVCKVMLNGVEIGGHEGGFVPFELDATSAVKPGKNELVVRVQSESIADSIACMSQYAAHQVGGIVRKVTMFCVPNLHVAELWHETGVAADVATVKVHSKTDGLLGGSVIIHHRLLDGEDKVVASAVDGQALRVANAQLWTSETPNLYTLETILGDPQNPREVIRQRIGLREVRVEGNQLLVNQRPVKLLGVNRHEVHPLTGRSISPELCRKDAELFRAANVNLVRTSHYPPSEEFLTACDELGIFVECEAAVCWIKHAASPVWKTWNHLDPQYLPYFRRANLDNVAANRNHPCVIIWSLANESLWTPLFAEVLKAVKLADPTRPVTFHDQHWGSFNNGGNTADIAVHHYPSESNSNEWSQCGRPIWFGEYAHVQCYNRRELVTDPGIRADWGRPLARMVDLMWQQSGCLGGAIWSGIDDVFHMPNGDLKGYGHWGPIDAWRREKPEYFGVRAAYSPLRILEAKTPADGPITLHVQNRFNFIDLSEVSLRWRCGDETGTVKTSLAPHAVGDLVINPQSWKPHQQVELTVIDPRGVTVAHWLIAQSKSLTKLSPTRGFSLVGNNLTNRKLEISLPVPMVLPLNGEGGAKGPAGSVLSNEIEPFTPVSSQWQPQVKEGSDKSTVIEGETDDVRARMTLTPRDAGVMRVDYTFTLKKAINPRQWGLVFSMPKAYDTLIWNRELLGVSDLNDQLDRIDGSAMANPVKRRTVEELRVKPSHAWVQDANALGSADFRSSRTHIKRALLVNAKSDSALVVLSDDASQTVRCWVDGDHIRMLVAGFHTGGSDSFFEPHYAAERRPLKVGDVVHSSFDITLVEPINFTPNPN